MLSEYEEYGGGKWWGVSERLMVICYMYLANTVISEFQFYGSVGCEDKTDNRVVGCIG